MGCDVHPSLIQVANAEGPTSITDSHLSNVGGAEAPTSGTDGPSPPSIVFPRERPVTATPLTHGGIWEEDKQPGTSQADDRPDSQDFDEIDNPDSDSRNSGIGDSDTKDIDMDNSHTEDSDLNAEDSHMDGSDAEDCGMEDHNYEDVDME
jgi:hypothetical protein